MKQVKIRNSETVIIRNATKSDALSLINYTKTIAGESDCLTFGIGEFNMTIKQEEAFLENILKKYNSIFIIAEINGNIVGGLSFLGGEKPRTMHTGELGMSVLKKYWGNGIGKELLKYFIEWSKSSKIIRKINLRVRVDNKRAIQLYSKFGFIKEGLVSRDFKIKDKFYNSWLMGLEID